MEKYSVIVGMGEVGKGLYKNLSPHHKVHGIDKDQSLESVKECAVLNVCIPHSESFVDIVNEYIDSYKPTLTINHSTVPVGTTRKLKGLVVHSPVRGKHPDLAKGLKVYVKYVGYNDDESLKLCEDYFKGVFQTKALLKTETTELAKLLSLARYGLGVAFAKEQDDMCRFFGVEYNEVVREWDETYNKGIELFNKTFKRPIYYVPEGKIGGHCVIPNTKELNKQFPSKFLKEVLKLG